MTTEVEVFYDHSVVEKLPVTEIDVVEVIERGPQGPPGAGFVAFVLGDTPIGDIDGVNVDFTTAGTFSLLWVWKNGQRQTAGIDYNVVGDNGFQFLFAPLPGDILRVDYVEI